MDEHIVPAVAIMAAFGFLNAVQQHKSPQRQLIAVGIFALLLTGADALGAGQIAGAIAMVAAVYVVVSHGGPVLSMLLAGVNTNQPGAEGAFISGQLAGGKLG